MGTRRSSRRDACRNLSGLSGHSFPRSRPIFALRALPAAHAGKCRALSLRCATWPGGATGIQRIFLAPDGLGKTDIDKPKLSLGSVKGGAIRLGDLDGSGVLTVCEGPEDGLSLLAMLGGSVWVAAGASFLPAMQFPAEVRAIVIGADNDPAGEDAASKAAHAFTARGLSVRIIRPLDGFKTSTTNCAGCTHDRPQPCRAAGRYRALSTPGDPSPLGDELLPVAPCRADMLPAALRPWLVECDRAVLSGARQAAWRFYRELAALDTQELRADWDSAAGPGHLPFLRFAPDAQVLFSGWMEALEHKLRGGELEPPLMAHLAKYRGLVPRLALLCHIASDATGSVSHDSLEMAVCWGDYLESHARRAYGALSLDNVSAARSIWRRVKRGDLPQPFTARDIQRKGWSGLGQKERVEAGLKALCEAGWLGSNIPDAGPGGGRPSTLYRANPKAAPSRCRDGEAGRLKMHGQETDKTDKTPPGQVLSVLSVFLPMRPGKLETGMTDAKLRQLWRQWCDHGGDFPPECRDMTCGAQTRAGTPCKRRDLYRSGRCKLHGGLSTGQG